MDLAEALGWRVSALWALRASDYDRRTTDATPNGRLLKRAATDKVGVEMWVPLSESARDAIERALQVNPCVGEMPLFPTAVVRNGRSQGRGADTHTRTPPTR